MPRILAIMGVLLAVGVRPASAQERTAAPDSAEDSSTPATDYDLTGWLDNRFETIWSERGVTPEFCDDATFVRRASLDLIGRIPSVAEVRSVLNDESEDKREQLIDRLLSDPEQSGQTHVLHAEHLARLWRRMLFPPGSQGAAMGRAFEPWLETRFRENVPYDQIVRELLTARGEDSQTAMVYYQAVGGTPEAQATEFSRVFLGVRIGCAQCHDHPFTDWKQKDFWGMAAFFAGTQLQQGGEQAGLDDAAAAGSIEYEGTRYDAKLLWSTEPVSLTEDQRPRDVLAEWMTDDGHPTFAANVVNRVWQQLLGTALIPDVDDLDLASAEERELVLNELSRRFVASGYDLRWLIGGICNSRVYACSSEATEQNYYTLADGIRPLKTLTPEQMFDSLEQAMLLPVSRSSDEAARHNGEMMQIVTRLDESVSRSPAEYSAGIPQTLMLMNGPTLSRATNFESSRTLRAIVDAPFLSSREKLDTLYLAALTRLPTDDERTVLLDLIEKQQTAERPQSAFGDIFWALLNSPEFVLSR